MEQGIAAGHGFWRSVTTRSGTILLLTLSLLCLAAGSDAMAAGKAKTAKPFRDCPTCPELVRIEPGKFLMGSTEAEGTEAKLRADRAAAERPQHEVTIAYPFTIGRHEVTVAEFGEFAAQSDRDFSNCFIVAKGAWHPDPKASWKSPGFATTPKQPATCLSPDDFEAYLAWLSNKTGHKYRFPTEAEWEYAARTGMDKVRIRALDDASACKQVNAGDADFRVDRGPTWPTFACSDGYAAVAPVGSFPSDKHGLYDMFGNVAEIVADCYVPNHNGAPTDGSARTDAVGCGVRIVKGASWAAESGSLRPAVRQGVPRNLRGDGHGLRVLRVLEPAETAAKR